MPGENGGTIGAETLPAIQFGRQSFGVVVRLAQCEGGVRLVF